MLRRHLPRSIDIGRGFIVSNNGNSPQIDILIYSADVPVLFRDGDLVFVTPDAVLGIIEVKTNLRNRSEFHTAATQLAKQAIWGSRKKAGEKFFGIFSYEAEISYADALSVLSEVADGDPALVVDLVCLGPANFVRWSKIDPVNTASPLGIWRAYQRLDGKAPGYFLHNAIQLLAPKSVGQYTSVWFPVEGKDDALAAEHPFQPRQEFLMGVA